MKRKYIILGVVGVIIMAGMLTYLNRPHYIVKADRLSIGTEFSINPCKVIVKNLPGGDAVKIPFTIKNDTDNQMVFHLSDRVPDRLPEGFAYYTGNTNGLSVFTDSLDYEQLLVAPQSSKTVNLFVSLERDRELDKNYEAWVSVETDKLPNYINTELCLRILIERR